MRFPIPSEVVSTRGKAPLFRQELSEVTPRTQVTEPSRGRKGKAPVDSFSGESLDVLWEDWIPTLERAALWNGWSDEKLLQLAGHLRGKAQQEWALLPEDQKATFAEATRSLRGRLDPGGRVVAAQDFQHVAQQPAEPVADYVRRLECTFRRAYGRETLGRDQEYIVVWSDAGRIVG